MSNCNICKRPMDDPNVRGSRDCGGDCLRCMALFAEDPDCIAELYPPRSPKPKVQPEFSAEDLV